MPAQIEHVAPDQVSSLVSRIFADTRDEPLVLVSCASDTERPRVDPAGIAEQNPEAQVVVLDSMETSSVLSDHVGGAFRAFGGAVRVIWPGARPSDSWRRHGLFLTFPDDDPNDTLARLRDYLANPMPRPERPAAPPPPRRPVAGVTPATLARHRGAVPGESQSALVYTTTSPAPPAPSTSPASPARTAGSAPARPAPRPAPPAPAPAPALPSYPQPVHSAPRPAGTEPSEAAKRELAGLESRIHHLERALEALPSRLETLVGRRVADVLEALLGSGSGDAERERERAEAAEAELRDARERNRQLRERLAQHNEDWPPAVYDDPEQQLRYEVEQVWLMSTPPSERPPLRPYRVSEAFLDDLADPPVERRKAVRCIVDVLTGPADPARIHPWKAGKAAPNVRRDGAMLWRYQVQRGSPQAARLMYWDGGPEVELVRLARHDDHRGLP